MHAALRNPVRRAACVLDAYDLPSLAADLEIPFKMAYNKRSRKKRQPSKRQSSKRSLIRTGASLMAKGISKCFPKSKDSGLRPTKAKTSTRRRSRRWVAKSQKPLVELANAQRSGEMVQFDARVVKTLSDDNFEDRHQRFIIEIDYLPSSINTVLIAHNIDLAPRVPVERGSVVRFYGQYEWNEKGGILHWTHHDPSNWREGGWIELHGKRYD